ncbi:lactonase family protein [Flavobacteriaceae bacterium MHTCC 0001]
MIHKTKYRFFIGSYTEMLTHDFGGSGEGIYTVEMDVITGEISVLSTYVLRNPAYLALKDGILYAITEVEQHKGAKVSALKVKGEGKLELMNAQSVVGSLPCHINIIQNRLMVACYGTGNVLTFPLSAMGEILEYDANFKHKGSSVNVLRQEAPHAHQIVYHPEGQHVFVPDLGIDTIKVYRLENDGLTPEPKHDVHLPKGHGPRHMVFNAKGDLGYVMNELTGNVAVLKRIGGVFESVSLYKALPDTFNDVPSGAAIRLHPNGKFLYVANRTINTITIFKVEGDKLQLLDHQYMHGKTVREFNITPNGDWLIACMQDSNEVISYRIQPNGLLVEKSRNTNITSPVCVCF